MTVEIDTSELEAGVRQLAADIDRLIKPTATATANVVAQRLRDALPKRSGRLAASVDVTGLPNGAQVTYGTGVPYASYIAGRTGAPDNAVAGADRKWAAAMKAAAAGAVGKL